MTRRYFRNGTVALYVDNVLDIVEDNPVGAAIDYKRVNYTDGSFVQIYEETGRKVYYPPPPREGINSTYQIATAILSQEWREDATERRVFRNGTIIIIDQVSGDYTYENQLNTTFNPTDTITLSPCSYILIDNVNMTKTKFLCPPAGNWTAKDNATAAISEITLRDNSRRVNYLNGTIARFDPNGKLIGYDVPPKSIFIDYPIYRNPDGSIHIDYTATNGTKRFIAAPLPQTATLEMRAMALLFKDTYLNGTSKHYF